MAPAGRLVDFGRAAITLDERDRGAFKTPTLREVVRTAPYMHDGSIKTLEEVVDWYSEGGRSSPNLDPDIRPISFTPAEKRALVAFLGALSGTISEGRLIRAGKPGLVQPGQRPILQQVDRLANNFDIRNTLQSAGQVVNTSNANGSANRFAVNLGMDLALAPGRPPSRHPPGGPAPELRRRRYDECHRPVEE